MLGFLDLAGVESLDSGGVILVFLLLSEFLFCLLPISSSSGCRWGLSTLVTQWCVWARDSMSAALDGLASPGSLLTLKELGLHRGQVGETRRKSRVFPDSGSSSLPGHVYPKQVQAQRDQGE